MDAAVVVAAAAAATAATAAIATIVTAVRQQQPIYEKKIPIHTPE